MNKKKAILSAVLALAVGSACGGLVACGNTDDPAKPPADSGAYYLTQDSTGWLTYTTNSSVPAGVKFTGSGSSYSLTVSLDANDEILVARVGSTTEIGYSALSSGSNTQLTEGEDDNIFVSESGTYSFLLNTSGSSPVLTYTYQEPNGGDDDVQVTGVTLNQHTLSLAIGDTASENLVATVAPTSASNKAVTWSVSPAGVISFDQATGAIEAVGKGTATITVTTDDGGFTDSCTVTVTNPCTNITLSSSRNMVVGGTLRLAATITPDDTDDTVSWSINPDDAAVAALSETTTTPDADGKVYTTVTASTAGTARVSVTCGDVTKTCVVNVSATSLEITGDEVLDVNGSAITLNASVNDSTGAVASQPTITWAAYDDADCDIPSSGVTLSATSGASITVTGLTTGVVYVKATCEYESTNFSAVQEINVIKRATDITLTAVKLYDNSTKGEAVTATSGTYQLEKGHSYIVEYTLAGDPSNGYRTVAWSSNATDKATVSAAVITATERGAATITGTINGHSVTIPVNVVVPATSMSVSVAGTPVEHGGTVHVARGGTAQITVSNILPAENDSTATYMSDSTDYATVSATGLITATAAKDGIITITVTCGNAVVEFTLVVDVDITVSFDEDLYKINVNNGGSAWTTTVSATANGSDAGVTYSIVAADQITAGTDVSSRVEVNSTSGLVTASQIGRYVVTATSVEDDTKTATTTVYVTSTVGDTSNSAFLALCDASGWGNGITFPTTTAVPTSHSDFRFANTGTADVYEVEELTLKAGLTATIAFLGMDSSWNTKLDGTYVDWDASDNEYLDSNPGNATFKVTQYGKYKVTLDLRNTLPSVVVELTEPLVEAETMTVYVVVKDTTTHLGEAVYDPDNPGDGTVTFSFTHTCTGWDGSQNIRFGTEGAGKNYLYESTGDAGAIVHNPAQITWSGSGINANSGNDNKWKYGDWTNSLWFGYTSTKTVTTTCVVTIDSSTLFITQINLTVA